MGKRTDRIELRGLRLEPEMKNAIITLAGLHDRSIQHQCVHLLRLGIEKYRDVLRRKTAYRSGAKNEAGAPRNDAA